MRVNLRVALILYIFNKQYITVDNTHQLLYTVYHKGEKKNYAYYIKSFFHGSDLRTSLMER